jgi:3-oxoacyl-[acyl-carrier-protein] synthase-3
MQTLSSAITGTGAAVPRRVITNADLERMVDTSDEWITTRTGIRERRVAEPSETLSDYAVEAGRQALEAAGVRPHDLDLIICATVTPDRPIPATSCTIQHRLGAARAAAFDMAAGCSGFIYALAVGDQFVRMGTYRQVLVIGAELLSKYVDWKDRTTCIIFADGAGAVLLSRRDGAGGVRGFSLHSDGSLADFIYVPAGGTALPPSETTVRERQHYIRMKGNETFKIAVRSLEEVSREVLEACHLGAADISLMIPHQANRRIIDAVGTRLGIDPRRVYVNIERLGNTSAASIPIALDEAVRRGLVKRGDRLLFSAFGAGLTWAAAVVEW